METLLRFLAQTLPRIKTKIQLSAFVVTFVIVLLARAIAPDQLPAQIALGATGIAVIIFAQIFHFLPYFPSVSRPRIVLTIFLAFLVFLLALIFGWWHFGDASSGAISARSQLLVRGIEPSTESLKTSIAKGDLLIADLLLTAGVSPNGPSDDVETPLIQAIALKRKDIVLRLLSAGANPNIPLNGNCSRPLSESITEASVLDLLLTWQGMNKLLLSTDCRNLVNQAAVYGTSGTVLALVKAGLPIQGVPSERQRTPLMDAVFLMPPTRGKSLPPVRLETAKVLIGLGANINIQDRDGQTALFIAVSSRSIDAVKLLLAAKADPNMGDDSGMSPLELAKRIGEDEIAAALKSAGAIGA